MHTYLQNKITYVLRLNLTVLLKTGISCNDDEFNCVSGQCIPLAMSCDGISDCEDGSDESPDQCSSCFVEGECIQSPLISAKIVENENQCLYMCQNDLNCNWFSYDPFGKLCETFQSCTNLSNENCGKCISGERSCEPNWVCGVAGSCEVSVVYLVFLQLLAYFF